MAQIFSLGHFDTMKQTYSILLLATALLGCRSTADPTDMSAWHQLSTVPVQTLTKQQVYAIAGKPLRETNSAAFWESPPVREGWFWSKTYVRELEVDFAPNGQVTRVANARVPK